MDLVDSGGGAARAAGTPAVVAAGNLRGAGAIGWCPRSARDDDAARSPRSARHRAAAGRRLEPHSRGRAADQSHLLRRTDLSEHWTEPRRSAARTDVQRRRRRRRPTALLQRRVQQAAVRVSPPAQPGVSPGRSRYRFRLRRECGGDGTVDLPRVSARRNPVRGPARRVLRGPAARAHAATGHLVGERGCRTVGIGGVPARHRCGRLVRAVAQYGVAGRHRRRSRICDPVSPRVALDRPRNRPVAVAAGTGGDRTAAVLVGCDPVRGARLGAHRPHRCCAQRRMGDHPGADVSALRRRQSEGQRVVLSRRPAIPGAVYRYWR